MKKGQIVNPVGYRKYLIEFIEGKNKELFTAAEAVDAVAASVNGVPRQRVAGTVLQSLCNWERGGFLLRDTGADWKFFYLGFVKPMPERLSMSEVAEAVWQALLAAMAPMRLREVCNVISPCCGRRLIDDVSHVLRAWHCDRVLHRDGKRRQYTYCLTDEARARGVRPPSNCSKKLHPIPSEGNMVHMA